MVFRNSIRDRGIQKAEAQAYGDGELDEDDMLDLKKLQMNQMELHFNITDLVAMLWKSHAETFVDVYVEHLHETVVMLSSEDADIEDQRVGAFFICDVLEHSSGFGVQLLEQYVPLLISMMTSTEDLALIQACAYGLGVGSRCCGEHFETYAHESSIALATVIQFLMEMQESMAQAFEESGFGTEGEDGIIDFDFSGLKGVGPCLDNCIASLVFIFGYQPSSLPEDFLLDVWTQLIDYLPLADEEEESVRVQVLLAKLLKEGYWSFDPTGELAEFSRSILIEGTWSMDFLRTPFMSRTVLEAMEGQDLSEDQREILSEMEALAAQKAPEDDRLSKKMQSAYQREVSDLYLNTHSLG
jgi:hypothetical protein